MIRSKIGTALAMLCICWLIAFAVVVSSTLAFGKLVVQAVHKEKDAAPLLEMQTRYNFSVFSYQKLDPSAPHYLGNNRGTETGVYLRYIVEHYDDFPDVAVFVHAHPHEHQPQWLEMVHCISPNATWYNINYGGKMHWIERRPESWRAAGLAQVVEQCWRDVLQTVWELEGQDSEFQRRLPVEKPLKMASSCCNQFLLSRGMVHRRPLHVWKQLLHIITEQPTCHIGALDYEHLSTYNRKPVKEAPEQEFYGRYNESADFRAGATIPGGAGEHLSHVIFGHQSLLMIKPTQVEMCQNFIRGCPGSPCQDDSNETG